jgi:hypothetical protein
MNDDASNCAFSPFSFLDSIRFNLRIERKWVKSEFSAATEEKQLYFKATTTKDLNKRRF